MSDSTKKRVNHVVVRWDGEQRFEGSRLGSNQSIRIDGTSATGPSPVDTLLCALASCAAIDAVEILAKRRTPVDGLTVEVHGQRADTTPARFGDLLDQVMAFADPLLGRAAASP